MLRYNSVILIWVGLEAFEDRDTEASFLEHLGVVDALQHWIPVFKAVELTLVVLLAETVKHRYLGLTRCVYIEPGGCVRSFWTSWGTLLAGQSLCHPGARKSL